MCDLWIYVESTFDLIINQMENKHEKLAEQVTIFTDMLIH